MAAYYLAVDIGASSGRHILGHMENGKMVLEEIYRFENGMVKKDGELCWEFDRLFKEVVNGLKKCKEIGKIPVSMGVDTWGVDFVLLDKDDKVLGNTVGYRDHRTEGMDKEVYKAISLKDLYARTGIQKADYNTIYQLMAVKKKHPEYLEQAETLLHVPDYFHFLLTGQKTCEYTEATTGQLVSPITKDWDYELIDMLGYPRKMFQKLIMPGTGIGHLSDKIREEVGFDLEVVAPATHDTGSAVLAVPANDDDFIYISSGTWSLMGIERKEADCSEKSCEMNFTNEGGYAGRFRYLKNIMGLWMIQSVRHEVNDAYSFAEICAMAEEAKDFPSRVDANDECFLSPDNMTEEVKELCQRIVADRNKPRRETIIDGYGGFLFFDKEGKPMVALHWEKYIQHARDKYNREHALQLPPITTHICRHTFCSNMARQGMNPKTIQYIMGHSDIAVTMNVYTHLGLDDAREEHVRLKEARNVMKLKSVM